MSHGVQALTVFDDGGGPALYAGPALAWARGATVVHPGDTAGLARANHQ